MADKTYNINIKGDVNFEALPKLIEQLNALSAEVAALNKMTFEGMQKSMGDLIAAGTSLTEAIKSQVAASDALKKSTDDVADGLKKTGDEANKTKEDMSNLGRITQGFYMELGAMASRFATQLPSAISKSIEAFGRQEMAVARLAAAIRSQGGNVSDVLPIMQSFASEIQRITTYGDEQILEIQSMAASMGVLPGQMNQVIQSAIGLSTALGTDLTSAARAAVAVMQGNTQKLQEHIPSLRDCKTETEKLAKAQELASSGFAQAKDLAQTSAGKLKQCANAWGDLAEAAGGAFAPVAADVAGLLKGMCEVISESDTYAAIFTGTLTTLAVAMAFQKIGGLPNIVAQIKLVRGAIASTDIAAKGLNATMKANPILAGISLAITAVTALGMAFSYFRGRAEETYKKNIEKSAQYRGAIDAEIESMKQWGISAEANKKRTAEVAAEIAKLKEQRDRYESSHGKTYGFQGGAAYKSYSKAEKAELDNYAAKIAKLEERQKAAANVKELDALASRKLADVEETVAKIREKSAEEAARAAGTESALQKSAEMLAKTKRELAAAEKSVSEARSAGNAEAILSSEQRLAAAKTDGINKEREYLELLQKSDEEKRLRESVKLQTERVGLETRLLSLKGEAPSDELAAEYTRNELLQRSMQIQGEYISARRSLCTTAAEYNALVEEAKRKSEEMLANSRAEAEIADRLASSALENKRLESASKAADIELEAARARARGDAQAAQGLEIDQRAAQLEVRRCELVKEHVESQKALCKTAEEYAALVDRANKRADDKLAVEKFDLQLSETRRENARQLESLELRIAQAKANGANYDADGRNRAAEKLEQQRSALQLQEQIFDSLRREGMTENELKDLRDYAINQAQQRVAYERQATDEMQRQNMAKNAQAKIEDIILTNKIEQLKAQGRMKEAQALVDEREIKRTMAGLQGVSEEDKKKLADMMRQTNGYKVSQQEQRSARSGGTSGGSRGGGDVSSALARKNSMMADGDGGSFGGGTGGSSAGNRKRPATVSAKYADLYDQWKAAGGSKSGQSWTAFRDANKGDAEDRKAGRQTASAKKFSANARAEIGVAEATAKSMTPRPPNGVAETAKSAQGNSATRSNKAQEQQKPQLAANPALNEKLGAMGASAGGGSDDNKAQSLGEIASAVKTMSETLETLKTTVSALAERKAK